MEKLIKRKLSILKERIEAFESMLYNCRVCPRKCGVNRTRKETGLCGAADEPVVSSYNVHHGEEPPISGVNGSGTIFFTGCSLRCCYCQNYPISQLRHGNKVSIESLSKMMLELQKKGAHNINLVTPTHFVPQVAMALLEATAQGLNLPIVYNSSGYESIETLKMLSGIIDIYMPDSKYSSELNSMKYSGVSNYPKTNRKALKEMFRQVGNLIIDDNGIAGRGLLVRHLVLPNNVSGSFEVLKFIAENISIATHLSIMAQYHPAYKSEEIKELSRKINKKEYRMVIDYAEKLGLVNGWYQEI